MESLVVDFVSVFVFVFGHPCLPACLWWWSLLRSFLVVHYYISFILFQTFHPSFKKKNYMAVSQHCTLHRQRNNKHRIKIIMIDNKNIFVEIHRVLFTNLYCLLLLYYLVLYLPEYLVPGTSYKCRVKKFLGNNGCFFTETC